jgi:sugar lactone lactonase YvrE
MMPYRCRFFFVSLLLGLCASPTLLLAQERTFDHLTTEDGLPSNIVEVILQDHRGYLWFGTWFGNGLVRYDGYEMKVFQHVEGDATSLSQGTVWALHESEDRTLWVGLWGGGLNRFEAAAGMVEVYRYGKGNASDLNEDNVIAIQKTDDGTLWFGTAGGGLYHFDVVSETFEVYRHAEGDATSLSDNWVAALLASNDGTLWAGTGGGGLNRFDAATGTFEVYRHTEGDATSLSDDDVHTPMLSRPIATTQTMRRASVIIQSVPFLKPATGPSGSEPTADSTARKKTPPNRHGESMLRWRSGWQTTGQVFRLGSRRKFLSRSLRRSRRGRGRGWG